MSSCNLPQRIFLSFLGEGINIAGPGKGFVESLIAFIFHRSFPREEPNHNAKSKYYQNYESPSIFFDLASNVSNATILVSLVCKSPQQIVKSLQVQKENHYR